LQHDALKMQNAVTYQPTLHASANPGFREMAKNCAQISMNVRDQGRVESTPIVTISLETTLAFVTKALKEIHTMDVSTLMNVHVLKLVDRVQFARILKAVIAATALKDSTEMPDQLDALITTNALDHLVEEMHTAPMKLELSGAIALKDM
jgi:hypothetical protein